MLWEIGGGADDGISTQYRHGGPPSFLPPTPTSGLIATPIWNGPPLASSYSTPHPTIMSTTTFSHEFNYETFNGKVSFPTGVFIDGQFSAGSNNTTIE
jgi:hypothetical protein